VRKTVANAVIVGHGIHSEWAAVRAGAKDLLAFRAASDRRGRHAIGKNYGGKI